MLPKARAALKQARRQLDELNRRENLPDQTEYLDFIPYALDRLLNVWRTINDETSGQRSSAFGMWWVTQRGGNQDSLRRLRNLELKQNMRLAKSSRIYRMANRIEVREDGSMVAIRPDGSIAPMLPGGGLDAGGIKINEDTPYSSRWEFVVQGLEDREVQEVLELVYKRLEEEVVPTAERLMSQ